MRDCSNPVKLTDDDVVAIRQTLRAVFALFHPAIEMFEPSDNTKTLTPTFPIKVEA